MKPLVAGCTAALLLAPAVLVAADPASADTGPDFARDVKPLFERHCWECHGAEKQEGGLRLDVREPALRGGDSGAAFVPGKSSESRLLRYISGLDEDYLMPPEGDRLTDAQIAVIRRWIDAGATWPESEQPAARPSDHWSFRPIARPALPVVSNASWVRNGIDRFILAKLEQQQQFAPAAEADRGTLLRRLSLDLTGLPPTPDEVREFLADSRPDAYERLVERLLASPHFGERYALDWLDLARYADSNGYDNDEPRPHAWRYRHWVIDAINRDLPYDKFGLVQLAGDLAEDDSLGDSIDRKVAVGFQRNTPLNTESGIDLEEFRVRTAVDRVNTIGTIWLGLTVGCAQCHAHKYDPISQRDFYGLFAFYNSVREIGVEAPAPFFPAAQASTLADEPQPRQTHVMIRGDYRRKGAAVDPGTLACLPPLKARGSRADRLDLARWLFDPAHPLTARVTANHFWQHLIGRGLVPSIDDFGMQGQPPTHPELLDYLAGELVARGWSRKQFIRLIALSATYRQSAQASEVAQRRDPQNLLLARQNRWRLEGELVRDLSLASSGLLHRTIGGPSFQLPLPPDEAKAAKWTPTQGANRYRRGLYIFVQRTVPYPMLATFDAPDTHVTCARRDRSNTPLQALTLLNDREFFECAQALGFRALREGADAPARIRWLFIQCLAREPQSEEASRLVQLLAELRDAYYQNPAEATQAIGSRPLPSEVAPSEAASWIGVARTVLNLDEFVTRE